MFQLGGPMACFSPILACIRYLNSRRLKKVPDSIPQLDILSVVDHGGVEVEVAGPEGQVEHAAEAQHPDTDVQRGWCPNLTAPLSLEAIST